MTFLQKPDFKNRGKCKQKGKKSEHNFALNKVFRRWFLKNFELECKFSINIVLPSVRTLQNLKKLT